MSFCKQQRFRISSLANAATWCVSALAVALLAGCSAKQYRSQADREVYGIIQAVEQQVFGHTGRFEIDTEWSSRDPDSILAPEIIEDRLATNRLQLSLQDALNLAASQSRRYQTEKERLYLTALTLTGERYEFGPQFFARSRVDLDRTSGGERRAAVGSSAGVSQFFKTGGSLGVNLANDILRYYTGDPRRSTMSTISVNLFQPLLRGFGKNNPAVERLTQAERNVMYAVRSFSFFQNQFAIEIVNDYFNLLGQKNTIRNNYSNYVSQVQSTKRLEVRSTDRESINQVDLARQSELAARNNYVNSIASYFNNLDSFKLKLSIPLNVRVFMDDRELEQLEAIGLIPVALDEDAAFRTATQRNYNLLNSIDQFEDAKRKIRVAADQFKPSLNLLADASLASEPPTDYTRFDFDEVRYGAGLELDLPIDRLNERNNYRATLVSFEVELRNLALDLDTLKDQIERGMRTLEQRRQNYEIQRNALTLARRRVQANLLLLEAGRAEVRDLVDSQNDLIAAQNNAIASLVSYQTTRLELLLNLGVIETESGDFWFRSHLEAAPEVFASESKPQPMAADLASPDEIFSH